MWTLFSRQTLLESGIMDGMTDYHSHVLPGVDDGIATLEKALHTLNFYEKIGVRDLWLTPHIMEDYPNRTTDLQRKFSAFSTTYRDNCGERPVTLHLASENMLDSLFFQRLDEGDLLPIIDGHQILVETFCCNPPFGFENILDQIAYRGYMPILAHPERYRYMSMSDYRDLHDRGIKFQLNLTSVVGAYGTEVQTKAHILLKKGYYSMLGSDLHHPENFARMVGIPVRKSVLDSLRSLINES